MKGTLTRGNWRSISHMRTHLRKGGDVARSSSAHVSGLMDNLRMPLIEPGKKAPAFSLKDQHGKVHKLSDYTGRPVILYFYPKDDTPGCTKESCEFQAALPRLEP